MGEKLEVLRCDIKQTVLAFLLSRKLITSIDATSAKEQKHSKAFNISSKGTDWMSPLLLKFIYGVK